MEKKKEEYAFEFQEFIAINNIKVKKLPKLLRKLIKDINEVESKAKKDCTPSHYKFVKNLFTPSANTVIDTLYEIFEDQIKNNKIVEVEEEATVKPDEAILEIMKTEGRDYVTTMEVYRLGVIMSKKRRTMSIGELVIRRGLGEDLWRIVDNTEDKGGSDE